MTLAIADFVVGGIPPDADQVVLNRCCFKAPKGDQCPITDDLEPLVVAAAAGRLRVFCRTHVDQLAKFHTRDY